MRTVILAPRRADRGHRDRLWDWCKARWQATLPDVPIFEGHHDEGPFNRSAAINLAAKLADKDGRWDMALVIDADIFIRQSQVRKAIDTAKRTGRVTWAHTRWRGISEDWTKRLIRPKDPRDLGPEIKGVDMDVLVEKTNPISWSCCIAIPREVWDQVGGFDERFIGWGFEDHAFRAVVCGLYGWERLPGDVYHLWHERTPETGGRATKLGGAYTVEALRNAQLGRRYMIALLRDHRIGDQPGQERLTPDVAAGHVRNLKNDLVKLVEASRRLRLPDWSDWWPTLEELRDGAKAHGKPKVTVVLTSGGTTETWPTRRDYLRQALASFTEHVTGPIVQRVVYSDWPEDITVEVEAIAKEFGFYVAGGTHVGYTPMRQRLWRYIQKRALGEFIFQAEDDFTHERPVDLLPMIEALQANPHLVQMALLRDPCYADEVETGGILGWPEPAFERKDEWLEHKLFFTANPSIIRRSLTATPWPSGKHSETIFGKLVLQNGARSAFWGDGQSYWIKHIGKIRAGVGY